MTLLLLSSLASAGDIEVSAEVGRIDVAQGDWDLFDWNSTQVTTGLRLEWHQSSRLAFSASYGHFVAGAHNSTWDYWDYEDTYTGRAVELSDNGKVSLEGEFHVGAVLLVILAGVHECPPGIGGMKS